MEDNLNEKLNALEEKRLAAFRENQKVKEQIRELQEKSDELYKEEFSLQDEISKLKSDGTGQFLGKFVHVHEYYIYVTSVTNEYSSSICALSGPYFYCYENSGYYSGGGKVIKIDSAHASAHHNAIVYVEKLEDVEIITREQYFDVFEKLLNSSRSILEKAIDEKPLRTKDNEFIYSEDSVELKEI
jgi:hypothetical protein